MNAPPAAQGTVGPLPAEDRHLGTITGQSVAHESARAHITGEAQYVDDIALLEGSLHAAPVMSPVAHGHLRGIDASAALALPGVIAVVTAADVPGDGCFATPAHDEPILATGQVLDDGYGTADTIAGFEYVTGTSFADRMTGGPFKSWLHRHIIESTPTGSRLTDDIEYQMVGGPLGNLFGGPIARRRLTAMFDHRHAVTRELA